jgi:hypothetical protein
LELRKQAEAAAAVEGEAPAGEAGAEAPAKKKAVKKTTRAKTSKKKKVDPSRLRMAWGVFDNSNQQVASFPYTERSQADKKAADLSEKGRGVYFVQPVKEPIPLADLEPAP